MAVRESDVGGVARGVVGDRVVGVVGAVEDGAAEPAAGVGHVPVGDLALDRRRGEVPFVDVEVGREVGDLEIAELRVDQEIPVGPLVLVDDVGRDAPVVVEGDPQRRAAAIGLDVVEVVLDEPSVVHGQRVIRRRRDERVRVVELEGARFQDVVDVAAVLLVEGDQADRDLLVDRNVDIALDEPARRAVGEPVDLAFDAGGEVVRVRLVGDQPQRAGERAGPEQGALRAGKRLHPGHVVDVQIDAVGDRGQRHFVDIDAGRRLGADVQAVAAAGDATEVDLRLAGPE